MRKTFKNLAIRAAARVPEIVAGAFLIAGLVVCGLILSADRNTPNPTATPQRVAVKNTATAATAQPLQKSTIARGF